MRPMLRPMGTARTLLASLMLAVIAAGAANAAPAPIPITEPGTVIDQPGHYYLAQNIDAEGYLFGLVIASNKVVLDMRRKTISGIGVDGILVAPDVADVHINNGTITGFAAGIHLASPDRVRITNMKILRNLVGIVGGRSGHQVSCNLVADNGFDGIYLVGNNHQVNNNRVVRNGNEELLDEFLGFSEPEKGCDGDSAGIRIEGDKSKLICNWACNNEGFGISVEGDGGAIYRNTACDNCQSGIRLKGDDALIECNKASGNDVNGIYLLCYSDDNHIEDNVAFYNDKYDIFDGNLPKACANEYEHNLFQTSNDPSGTCIQ